MDRVKAIQRELEINADNLDSLYIMKKRRQINDAEFEEQDQFLNIQRQILKDKLIAAINN